MPRQSGNSVRGRTGFLKSWGLRASVSFPPFPSPFSYFFALAPIFARSINLLFFSFFYLGFLKVCLDILLILLFAMPIDSWKPGVVLEKCIINALAVRIVEKFLRSASLENSKQRDKDAQFFATVSSNLHVDVHFHCSSHSFSSILSD